MLDQAVPVEWVECSCGFARNVLLGTEARTDEDRYQLREAVHHAERCPELLSGIGWIEHVSVTDAEDPDSPMVVVRPDCDEAGYLRHLR